MIRILIFSFLLMLVSFPAWAQKAGVGAWENSRYTMLEWIERAPALGWYYNWRPDQMYSGRNIRRTVEFVPMVHNARDVNKPIVSKTPVTTLLGFNEPDNRSKHQANMSVEQAIALWPRLEARGLRLGSPATTQGQTFGRNSWQRRFMNQVEAKGLRVDFMAVHYYSKDGDINDFRRWLRQVYKEYRRPIWVTEFARIDWNRPGAVTYEQNAAFAKAAIEMMEQLPFVERHAWFAANPYKWGRARPEVNLVTESLAPTRVGQAFEQVLTDVGSVRVSGLSN